MNRPDLSGNKVASRFKLVKRLGSGFFGDVYLVEQDLLPGHSALKIVPVDYSAIVKSTLEPKLQHISSSDHTVRVISAQEWRDQKGNDFVLIEMDYIDGGSFQDRIDSIITLPESVSVIKDVLFALEHLHREGIIHRDVKPTNILIGKHALLSDFGIAMVAATGASANDMTYSGNKAPECIAAKSYTPGTDVFAAGLALFRAVNLITDWGATRQSVPKWQDRAAAGTLVRSIGFHPRVPTRLQRIVLKACHADPSLRYKSAAEFRDALEKLEFAREWRQAGANRWECDFDGLQEIIEVIYARAYSVVYTRNGRRKMQSCRSNLSAADAQTHANSLLAETTFYA